MEYVKGWWLTRDPLHGLLVPYPHVTDRWRMAHVIVHSRHLTPLRAFLTGEIVAVCILSLPVPV